MTAMNSAASLALLPFSGLYAGAVATRLALYKAGVLRTHDLGVPVISVGNITAGGTGKTPLVDRIARHLASQGRHVCILTRGYGRTNPSHRVVVSDGRTILADPEQTGDEPLMLAEKLVSTAVVISDHDRVSAARWAIENLQSNVFVLDDGFQQLRVARDLNIVTIDATNPWSNRRLLPAGLLREPRSGLARADCFVITRVDEGQSIDALRREIVHFSKDRPVFLSQTKISALRPRTSIDEDSANSTPPVNEPVAAFCAIGNPESFFSLLRRDGRTLSYTRAFRDHHHYVQSDIDSVASEARANGARALLTTAKDEVKLRALDFDLPCYVVDIEVRIDDDKAFNHLISQAVRNKLNEN